MEPEEIARTGSRRGLCIQAVVSGSLRVVGDLIPNKDAYNAGNIN